MKRGPLADLVDAARALAGERAPAAAAIAWPPAAPPPGSAAGAPVDVAAAGGAPVDAGAAARVDLAAVRRRVGALLEALARRMDEALGATLSRAARAWDQVDALTVLEPPLRADAAALRDEALRMRAAASAPPDAAAAAEVVATVDAALALVTLVERRLATLARLRLRSDDGDLTPGGRPFLDVGAALAAAARGWA